ncbi:uncharacterized protein LOC113280404 [Papaver somniferum]|uniref:uncharacterized protein LOC113280404 n=1 Tax=Papaver somniferum TaxID=3469 RepID=UPI000E6FE9C1|nr:uncharacterized protein LOC113280404 [Papaver somniferum]
MAGLSSNPSTSNANAQGMNGGGGYQTRSQGVILRNMRKRCVALGHIDRSRPLVNDEFHLVQIDEVCLESEALCDGDGTFKDVIIGQKILWPQHSMSQHLTTPNKDWMFARKGSPPWIQGVQYFIQFATESLGEGIKEFRCPCMKCKNYNSLPKSLDDVHGDILDYGFDRQYRTWIHHGEQPRVNNVQARSLPANNAMNHGAAASFPRIFDLFNETLGRVGDGTAVEDGTVVEAGTAAQDKANVNCRKRLEDAVQPLFPGCDADHTKLSATVELLSMQARYQCSDVFMTELFGYLKIILPDGNTLPSNCRKAKDMIKPFQLPVHIIHACINDCILYRKDYANEEKCPKCGESRWKKPPEGSNPSTKKVPVKRLRYFPVTERLQRMYGTTWIAELMTWYAKVEESATHMRHPVDSSQWKSIDMKWPEFAEEKRNVRLGLATDGFNPFGMMTSHSTWPVMLTCYNLPPSECTSKDFTMLTLLIPGPLGPNHNIDVYLQPLIDELIDLWTVGKVTYDAHTKTSFTMKAMLLWCIHDFPAYAHVSGLRTSGRFGCPVCGENTEAFRLKWGSKYAYMGHRRFLRDRFHPYRLKTSEFNGFEETRGAPRRLSGAELFDKTATADKEFGKLVKRPVVQKNFTENLFGTFMSHKDKNKDGKLARKDLKLLNLKPCLWLTEENGKVEMPHAPYSLSKEEREVICKTLSTLKVPIGYSANWKRKVCLKDFQLKGLKSHDYHILMQGLMPIFMMHCFKEHKPLREAVRHLSLFFKVLTSKVIDRAELQEAHQLGPVQFRWMYPYERMMRYYKVLGRNKNYVEGSITKQYEINEGARHCVEILPEKRRKSLKCRGKISMPSDVYEGPYPPNSQGKPHSLTNVEHEQVRLWILRHSDENTEWEEKYEIYVRNLNQTRTGRIKPTDYIEWLQKQLEGTPMTDFRRLAIGPTFATISYNSYFVNGYLFYTADAEKNLTTQNSGVTMDACTSFRAKIVFYCDWVRVEDKVHGSYVDPDTKLRFVNFRKFMRSSKEVDEPFIHASQARQVFYCRDVTREHWNLVLESPIRSDPNKNALEDPFVFTANANEAPSIFTVVGEDEYWNEEAQGMPLNTVGKVSSTDDTHYSSLKLIGTTFFVVCEPGTHHMDALLDIIYEVLDKFIVI